MYEYHRHFRDCLGLFSTGITIITTLSTLQTPVGLTINSFNSVSLDPPLILFSLDKNSSSFPHFQSCPVFAVNILAESQVTLSRQFATTMEDKWHNLQFSPGKHTGCAILPGILGYLECQKEAVYEGGDHWIFIGRVMNFDIISDAPPLLYFKGMYRSIGEHCYTDNTFNK